MISRALAHAVEKFLELGGHDAAVRQFSEVYAARTQRKGVRGGGSAWAAAARWGQCVRSVALTPALSQREREQVAMCASESGSLRFSLPLWEGRSEGRRGTPQQRARPSHRLREQLAPDQHPLHLTHGSASLLSG